MVPTNKDYFDSKIKYKLFDQVIGAFKGEENKLKWVEQLMTKH